MSATQADLAVNSELIRQAAQVVQEAAEAYARPAGPPGSPLVDGCLGTSAIAREVVVRAGDGLTRAGAAVGGLATLSGDVAGRLRTVATAFDAVESIVGPR